MEEKITCPRCKAECENTSNYCCKCGEKIELTFEQYTKKAIANFRHCINTHSQMFLSQSEYSGRIEKTIKCLVVVDIILGLAVTFLFLKTL